MNLKRNKTFSALRESTRAVALKTESPNGTSSPVPEAEETHKYVENVMTKSNRSDIFSQEGILKLIFIFDNQTSTLSEKMREAVLI